MASKAVGPHLETETGCKPPACLTHACGASFLLVIMAGARDTADGPREGSPNPWESNPMKWYAEAGFSVASQVGVASGRAVDTIPSTTTHA